MQPWKTNHRKTILNYSKFLVIEEHEVELPDGTVIPDWPWLILPDYVIIVALTGAGDFLVFRQTKYAINGETLAPVGGYLEPGEEPLQAAKRELLEETGCQTGEWISLGHYPVDANRGAGTAHLFLALDTQQVTHAHADDLEEQHLLYLSRSEIEQALHTGAFRVLPWTSAFALALLHLDAR